MKGNGVGWSQPPSALASAASAWVSAKLSVLSVTEEEYQPSRVLISVLFTPAARTWSRTSPDAGTGIGTSR